MHSTIQCEFSSQFWQQQKYILKQKKIVSLHVNQLFIANAKKSNWFALENMEETPSKAKLQKFSEMVILYQSNIFCHQLAQNMTTDFIRFTQIAMKFKTCKTFVLNSEEYLYIF